MSYDFEWLWIETCGIKRRVIIKKYLEERQPNLALPLLTLRNLGQKKPDLISPVKVGFEKLAEETN
ncbi:hypothetical protein GCM10007876_30440 [Litoribrevibacter albus]|uniref:Uncharacterized protein n=1 Tax=Litoribrevibacter albus TaxID=1473156 RepID=A0AA37SAY4_9GAMM|nr:hypothetical protein GCM10007876_30440 [Litoribrevibacter albus]